jgi:hypothetical protein
LFYFKHSHLVILSVAEGSRCEAPHEGFPDWGSWQRWQRKALTDEVNLVISSLPRNLLRSKHIHLVILSLPKNLGATRRISLFNKEGVNVKR